MRCSSESPKRLRFASSDQLDQKSLKVNNQLESIVDNSPCKTKTCAIRSSCIENWRSSSNSCPCVEKLYDQEIQPILMEHELPSDVKNVAPLFRTNLIFGNESSLLLPGNKSFRFGTPGILQITCRSAPSSPKHSTTVLNAQKRAVQSNEEIDGWDAMTPLIYCPGSRLEWREEEMDVNMKFEHYVDKFWSFIVLLSISGFPKWEHLVYMCESTCGSDSSVRRRQSPHRRSPLKNCTFCNAWIVKVFWSSVFE